MRHDDILMSQLYNAINSQNQELSQIDENILTTVKDFLKKPSDQQLNQRKKDEVLKMVNDLKIKLMELNLNPKDFINYDTFDNLIQIEPEPEPEPEPDQKNIPPNWGGPSNQLVTPTRSSTEPSTQIPPKRYQAPSQVDLDEYKRSKESNMERVMRKVLANNKARENNQPIPYPEVVKKPTTSNIPKRPSTKKPTTKKSATKKK